MIYSKIFNISFLLLFLSKYSIHFEKKGTQNDLQNNRTTSFGNGSVQLGDRQPGSKRNGLTKIRRM